MKLGIQSLQFTNSPNRPLADQIDDAIVVLREADRLDFDWVSASQHWVSAPTVWPQPFPILTRLAPELPNMRLMSQMVVLPLHNPIDVAEQAATVDQISRGRLTLGCANGYRELELHAAGFERKDRVSRVEEAIPLMKRLWSGEEVVHDGRWWRLDGGRMGFTPYQQPHPPIVLAAQSRRATQRAARIADGVFYGPQINFDDLKPLIADYHAACEESGKAPGIVGAGRSVVLADSREEALSSAREYAAKTMSMYKGWDMQERSMAQLQLEGGIEEWAILGSPDDCVAAIEEAASEVGLDHITLTPYNLPADQSARIEYVQRLGEEVVQAVKRKPRAAAGAPG